MNFKQHILPHVSAFVIFTVIVAIFFSPLVFGGKIINQHDIVQGLGASQEIIDFRERTGDEALWTNSMFGGMPAYLINTRWSGDLMLYLQRLFTLGLPAAAGVTLTACLSFYLLLLVFKVRPWLAIIGGLAFSLGSFNIISIEAGHMWKMWAIAYTPAVLGGVHLTVRGKHLPGLVLTALGLALELRSNHLQITYYLLLLLVVYGATQLIFAVREGRATSLFKSLGFLVIAAVIALSCNLGKIWSVYEYGQYSTRGPSDLENTDGPNTGLAKDYAFRWSNGIMEPLTLLIPEFFGGPSVSTLPVDSNLGDALRSHGLAPVQIRQQLEQVTTYWGKQPSTAGPSYAGAIVIFFFVLGYSMLARKHLIWITTAVIISIVLSWGSNFDSFNSLMFDYFPGYNKFRSVSMTLVIALLCIPLAAFLSLEKLLKAETTKELIIKVRRAAIITGGVLVLAIIYSAMGDFRGPVDEQISGQVPPWYLDALRADRAGLLRSDAVRSLVLIALALTALYFNHRNKISAAALYGILGVLIVFDLWNVNSRYLQSEDFEDKTSNQLVTATAADQKILSDQDPNYRVLSYLQNPWAETRTSYFHKSLGGYHGAKVKRYQELIEGSLDNQYRELLQALQTGQPNWTEYGVINMLNTRYLLVGSEENSVIRNPNALGNAWLVSNIKTVYSADEELAAVSTFNPASTAVIDISRFPVATTSYNSTGTISLVEYRPNYLKYQFESPEDAFTVFSEIYYPKGWVATVDGNPVNIIRANYILRALELPAGKHIVEFKFAPMAYTLGNKVMMVSSILLLILLAGTLYIEARKSSDRES